MQNIARCSVTHSVKKWKQLPCLHWRGQCSWEERLSSWVCRALRRKTECPSFISKTSGNAGEDWGRFRYLLGSPNEEGAGDPCSSQLRSVLPRGLLEGEQFSKNSKHGHSSHGFQYSLKTAQHKKAQFCWMPLGGEAGREVQAVRRFQKGKWLATICPFSAWHPRPQRACGQRGQKIHRWGFLTACS